jgi:transcriptional regulator with XRE-family HTH domain
MTPLGTARRRPNPALGAAAARTRAELKVSQTELGRRLGCTQQFVSRCERGAVPMTPARVRRVAAALGVSPRRIYLAAQPTLVPIAHSARDREHSR